MPEIQTYITCPFCQNRSVTAEPGVTRCHLCDASFEIDDRGECMYGDPESLTLPALGTICATCGLIQAGENQNCLYCGLEINTTVQ